ncbi:hypothetical protein PVA44_01920 [Entomospira nematocerorum]|uniref:Uncharacterized protein n=1 Tax=Entomospira nematocerorum TaxID=2719987 RepID=A0A968GCA8_9SPIO|nr:hypothetical protein [Entomospira nematocera]NIZ47210.1 hypothetical protein [Entomospira nematocera]WDI34247.1 hypothetical protein PVA44_01920 [Entomospira nematocera]
MRILKILVTIGLLSWSGIAQESIQRMNGFDWQRGASYVIPLLEEQFGAGTWLVEREQYHIEGASFLGHQAVMQLHIEGDFIRKIIFSWKDTGDTLMIRQYWRALLQELLGVMVEVNLFSGEYTWHVGAGNMVRWRSFMVEEEYRESAQTVKGRLVSKGSSRRLYSIDGEEYETEEIIEIEDLEIGDEQSRLIRSLEHQVELYFLPPLSSTVVSDSEIEESTEIVPEDSTDD